MFVTTAIPYVNAPPHIGHALELVQADAYARFQRQQGRNVTFLTGTDEHGSKIEKTANARKLTPQTYCDQIVQQYITIWNKLSISNSDFIRTTDQRHRLAVERLWQLCRKDISKQTYRGHYCVGCEAFLPNDSPCEEHTTQPEVLEEINYFFDWQKYLPEVRNLIVSGRFEIIPVTRKNETLNVISALEKQPEGISVTRAKTNVDWGIPVPYDDTQTIYVWFDALANYLSGIGFATDEQRFKSTWPCDVHFIGKGILKFHAVLWPAILISAGIELPRRLVVHGYITSNGSKISKSLENVVDPNDLVGKFGSDALRYYLLSQASPFEDLDYTEERFRNVYNADLANTLGNLVGRLSTLALKLGHYPVSGNSRLQFPVKETVEAYTSAFDAFRFDEATKLIWAMFGNINKLLADEEPWKNPEKLDNVLYDAFETLRITTLLAEPIVPKTVAKIHESFGFADKSLRWSSLTTGKVNKLSQLFPRVTT